MNASHLRDVRIEQAADGATLHVHVRPGAKRAAILGVYGERLKVAVNAPPEGGRANTRLLQALAEAVGLPRSRLAIVTGATSRQKRVSVSGLTPTELRTALEKALQNG